MSKSYRPPDYAEYHFSLKEGALAVLEGMFVGGNDWIFFLSLVACLSVSSSRICLFYEREEKGAGKKA